MRAQSIAASGLEARARERRGAELSLLGRLQEAQSELEVAAHVLQQLQDRQVLTLALSNLGTVLTQFGHLSAAQTHFERALAVAEQRRPPDWIAWQAANCGQVAFVCRDWPRAHRYVEHAMALRPRFEPTYWTSAWLYEVQGQLEWAEEQLQAASQSAQAGLALAEQSGDLQRLWGAHRALAELELLQAPRRRHALDWCHSWIGRG